MIRSDSHNAFYPSFILFFLCSLQVSDARKEEPATYISYCTPSGATNTFPNTPSHLHPYLIPPPRFFFCLAWGDFYMGPLDRLEADGLSIPPPNVLLRVRFQQQQTEWRRQRAGGDSSCSNLLCKYFVLRMSASLLDESERRSWRLEHTGSGL